MTFYRNNTIEETVEGRLLEFEQTLGRPLTLPVPIDQYGELVLGLDLLWDEIDELPGELILGGILPKRRLVVLNDRRRAYMDQKPGLERSTKGHEFGHWDLFVDRATLNHPALFDEEGDGPFAFRSSPSGEVAVIRRLESSEEGRALLKKIQARADEADEARTVNRYAACVSMPRALVREEAGKIDRTKWPNLYDLAERFDVTISALVVRLKQLNLLYIKDKELFESRDHAIGQHSLF